MSRRMVSGSCWLFAVALVEALRVTSEAMSEGRRLLTSSRMITSPMRLLDLSIVTFAHNRS